ncbi:5-dehydro-4-deoxyglucarate dehydratase [Streptacidiphilus rugosus]|uniref:5-dehydro-4-deoxyglucarate dehydratase n=1 Tax=Streptacidiphilus rugosus TaxID=405783 RepID=UPI00068EF642|nr:5-dehydro-4-deoxyglucarate dehydratase [Streptacidiphilus rugosus]
MTQKGSAPVTALPSASLPRRLDGLLFFPVTAFDRDGAFDPDGYRAHLEARLADGPAAVFAACGTGEFPALAPAEYERCLRVAVETTAGRVPVVGGSGYGTALALEYARAAERAGADGLLVLPPYSAEIGQEGLLRHYTALAEGTRLDLVLYQRDQVAFTPDTVARLAALPGIAGFKDGRGDLDLMLRIVSAVRSSGAEDFLFFNGMPTAEMTQQAYRAIGVPLYSSAIFCFAPDLALAFHRALEKDDTATLATLTEVFLRPYVELRRLRPGYAVSLVKAATRAVGHPVGQVRAPLTEPEPEHLDTLLTLVDRAREALR